MKASCSTLLVLSLCTLAIGCTRKSSSSASHEESKTRRGTFTIGKKTTFVDGPVDKNGHIDYAAALNERLREGVTPANNAAVLLWQAIGPNPGLSRVPDGFFAELGMPAPSPSSDYFIAVDSPTIASGTDLMKSSGVILDQLSRRPWKAKDYPVVASWLTANQKPLALVVEASRRTQFYSPVIPARNDRGSKGLWSSNLPGVTISRDLAIALIVRAMLHTGEEEYEAAWHDLLACHRLGRSLARGGFMVEGLAGVAIDQIACNADLAFISKSLPNSAKALAFIRDLRSLPLLPGARKQVDLGERLVFLDTVMAVDRNGMRSFTSILEGDKIPDPPQESVLNGIDWDPALMFANNWYDRAVGALGRKNRATRNLELADLIDTDLMDLQDKFLDGSIRLSQLEPARSASERGQIVGEYFLFALFPAVRKVQDAHDRGEQSLSNVIVAFALSAYRRDNGRYPESLEALAPKYLESIPIDLFSGESLIYKPTADSYLLYSVGPNGIDGGGHAIDDDPKGDDIVVRMPSLPPK